ncbi:MAG: hypothetical protein HY369_04280 [Candidatus Aenigmarchaeota archaeon]|nr:hypothetical protein [Candidatus Aenigmarchaeota archaeon]
MDETTVVSAVDEAADSQDRTDNIKGVVFGRRLLALWERAQDLPLPVQDFAVWSGASKDLLLALGMRWDGERYVFDAIAADGTPIPIVHPCPRCGKDRERETNMLCPTCWEEVPPGKRTRWCRALMQIHLSHPAALAVMAWALPDNPTKAPSRPQRRNGKPVVVKCRKCGVSGKKPPRGLLAQLLREILPSGMPKQVRERAEQVARRLDGYCETCAARDVPKEGT